MQHTAEAVAAWMRDQVVENGELYQMDAASAILDHFGEEFVYENQNGNPAIRRDVLAEFRKLTAETVIWEPRDRYWRLREEFDAPGRRVE